MSIQALSHTENNSSSEYSESEYDPNGRIIMILGLFMILGLSII